MMATTTLQVSNSSDGTTSTSPLIHGAQPLSHHAATGQISITTTAAAKHGSEPALPLTSETSHLTAASANGAQSKKRGHPPPESSPTLVDSDGEVEEEEDILGTGIEGDEVGKLLRSTVSELETALQVDIDLFTTHIMTLTIQNLPGCTGIHALLFNRIRGSCWLTAMKNY